MSLLQCPIWKMDQRKIQGEEEQEAHVVYDCRSGMHDTFGLQGCNL
jgi:hypothetical protein